ncbi:class I SAM-dependent methyltransferase [Nitriliruptoraceae bacterium ZYF776]|nr:class I SAM-dependent methyltransferase [Profundirhabdus halotolerans]
MGAAEPRPGPGSRPDVARQVPEDPADVAGEVRFWDELYRRDGDDAAIWSGAPNGTLVAEVTDLAPGRALDVGCGEGADAIWLAQRGWQVTAVDPSAVAVARAEAAARAAGVDVRFEAAGLLEVPGGVGQHDLVSMQYGGLRRRPDDAGLRALLDAVAPGGTLLVVHHEVLGDGHEAGHGDGHGHRPDQAHGHGGDRDPGHDDDGEGPRFDPADFVLPDDVAARLGDGFVLEVHEVRDRPNPPAVSAHHVRDVVVRARRQR